MHKTPKKLERASESESPALRDKAGSTGAQLGRGTEARLGAVPRLHTDGNAEAWGGPAQEGAQAHPWKCSRLGWMGPRLDGLVLEMEVGGAACGGRVELHDPSGPAQTATQQHRLTPLGFITPP